MGQVPQRLFFRNQGSQPQVMMVSWLALRLLPEVVQWTLGWQSRQRQTRARLTPVPARGRKQQVRW